LKDVKELVYGGFGRITKQVWAKAEDHVLKIEKEYGTGADPEFQVRGGAHKKIAPSGERRENFWGIS
jgi:hypothetical protein